jgi:hypothetical protein
MQSFPDKESLLKYLGEHLNFCNCASGSAWLVLQNTLKIISERSNPQADKALFNQKTEELTESLQLDSELGLGEWFVYFLESKDLISHGFNSADCWITTKGRDLLDAMEKFADNIWE